MKTLLADLELTERDQLQVGLEAFPGVQVEYAEGFLALDRARSRYFDFMFIGIDKAGEAGMELFSRVCEKNSELGIIIVASELVVAQMRKEKARGRVFAFLKIPLDPVELYRTIHRALGKKKTASAK